MVSLARPAQRNASELISGLDSRLVSLDVHHEFFFRAIPHHRLESLGNRDPKSTPPRLRNERA